MCPDKAGPMPHNKNWKSHQDNTTFLNEMSDYRRIWKIMCVWLLRQKTTTKALQLFPAADSAKGESNLGPSAKLKILNWRLAFCQTNTFELYHG